MRVKLLIILFLSFSSTAFAFDGSITTEGQTYTSGYKQVQTELNIGKKFNEGMFRPYLAVTYLTANTKIGINSPQVVYKVGSEYNPNLPISLMTGVGYYQNLVRGTSDDRFGYISIQYKFDTDSK